MVCVNGSYYKKCYSNKYVRYGDPVPRFDLLHPKKLAPIPIYNLISGKMVKMMIPYEITVYKIADDADQIFLEIKKKDLMTWHYLKEKFKQWRIENAKKLFDYSKKENESGNSSGGHKRLIVPYLKRFDWAYNSEAR
jgi:hypothetical protein